MARSISLNQLSSIIEDELKIYNQELVAGTKENSKKAAAELVKLTKAQRFDRDTGDYRKAISSKQLYTNNHGAAYLWYVKSPQYRLTHLLENGHATRNGGRTKAYKFVSSSTDVVEAKFIKSMEELI